jgi:hypothetical protein
MTDSIEKQLEELRSKNKVRLVNDEENGTGVDRLPGGVYGFTYSPAETNFPLFKDHALRSFEAHKLKDGSAILIGFLTEGESLQMTAGRDKVKVHLFPEPQEEAKVMVTVPMTRVVGHTEHSQRAGKGLELEVGPLN